MAGERVQARLEPTALAQDEPRSIDETMAALQSLGRREHKSKRSVVRMLDDVLVQGVTQHARPAWGVARDPNPVTAQLEDQADRPEAALVLRDGVDFATKSSREAIASWTVDPLTEE